jgi:hypothetical protein
VRTARFDVAIRNRPLLLSFASIFFFKEVRVRQAFSYGDIGGRGRRNISMALHLRDVSISPEEVYALAHDDPLCARR